MFKLQNGKGNRNQTDSDSVVRYLLIGIASVAVLVLFFILIFIINNSTDAIREIGLWHFLTDNVWSPSSGKYGAANIIIGTLLVTAGAVAIAVPLGIGAAIYMSEIADERIRRILKPAVELFAGIPSVVYGFFGLMVMVPFLAGLFSEQMPTGFAWITGSVLLGIMALPTIVSVSEDALRAVPRTYREASLAMGATKWETIAKVVVPAAVSGLASAAILGIGRAVGETMAVMMVTGNAAIVPDPLWNVFSFLRTITATLAIEMPEVVVGSTHYSALFLLGLVLMVLVLFVNLTAKHIVKMTERKFQGKRNDKQLRKFLGKKGAKQFKRSFFAIITFAAFYMAMSLFISQTLSIAGAVVLSAVTFAVRILLRKTSRQNRQKLAFGTLLCSVLLCVSMLVILIGDIVYNALPAISWEFLTSYPKDAGKAGGIFPAIVGTLELIAGTAIIALPLGILSGVYLTEYAGKSRFADIVEQAIDVLNGTPSIVFALFGLSAIVTVLGLGVSLISGCITMAFMILPVIIRTTEEAIRNVPHDIREASYALGAKKWQTTFYVVLPAALGGIMTGSILGLGRAAGETAPVMFTAAVLMKYSVGLNPLEPIMVLPYHLYYLATEGTSDPAMQYATALVLLVIVLSMFLVANIIRERSNRKTKW